MQIDAVLRKRKTHRVQRRPGQADTSQVRINEPNA